MTYRLALLIAAAAFPVPALAGPFADLAAVDRAVVAFTGVPQGQPGGALRPVDRRLKLAPCVAPLALNWHTARRESVVVQCADAGGWRLFVPVLAVQGAAAAPVIARGEAVTIAVSGEGFTVSQPGEALEPGAQGAWIRVRTTKGGTTNNEPLRAQVIRPGLVAVPAP